MKNWLIILLVNLLLVGCGMKNNEGGPQTTKNVVNVKNSTIQNVDRKTGQEISERLVELASSVPNVNDATAIVLGKYAIVGIDINKNLERSEVGSIKYTVGESLRHDPYGARAIVIADPDLNARLKEISVDIKAGKPVQGIMNELADIAGRLMPEIPADMGTPEPLEKNKKGLDTNADRQLEKQQQEQSNFHK